MKKNKNILLICGGGGTEHEISLLSAEFLYENLLKLKFNIHFVEICKDGIRRTKQGVPCELRKNGELFSANKSTKIDFIIPCIHGPPGETGQIQAVFELMNVPYLGAGPEASILSFNKVSTKLWMDALKIPNTPYFFVSKNQKLADIETLVEKALNEWGEVFIKASSQGSSVGCYKLTDKSKIRETLTDGLKYSPYLLIEKAIKGRELEIAVFSYDEQLIATDPGEINCPDGFYTYQEKYNPQSKTTTHVQAKDIPLADAQAMKTQALHLFQALNISHLARVDFFYLGPGEFYINEINTFPGMTKISMFPKMLAAAGYKFDEFLEKIISHSMSIQEDF